MLEEPEEEKYVAVPYTNEKSVWKTVSNVVIVVVVIGMVGVGVYCIFKVRRRRAEAYFDESRLYEEETDEYEDDD